MNLIYFPLDWKTRYREYYDSMNEYQRQGKNEHDDAEDCTTSIAEELTKNNVMRGI
jgi:predicted phage terminase large subunit-like protein